MANFQQAPNAVLTHPPASASADVRKVLESAGTYTIYSRDKVPTLYVPIGNESWKGPQARVVAVWGGDATGARLTVTPRHPLVDVTLVSEAPVAPHVWAYIVKARLAVGDTQLEMKTRSGGLFGVPLAVKVLPESVGSSSSAIRISPCKRVWRSTSWSMESCKARSAVLLHVTSTQEPRTSSTHGTRSMHSTEPVR